MIREGMDVIHTSGVRGVVEEIAGEVAYVVTSGGAEMEYQVADLSPYSEDTAAQGPAFNWAPPSPGNRRDNPLHAQYIDLVPKAFTNVAQATHRNMAMAASLFGGRVAPWETLTATQKFNHIEISTGFSFKEISAALDTAAPTDLKCFFMPASDGPLAPSSLIPPLSSATRFARLPIRG